MKKRYLCLALVLVMLVGIIPFSAVTVLAAEEPENVPVTGLSFDYSYGEIPLGKAASYTITVYPENATNKNILYTSSDYSVAVVDPYTGRITAMKHGTATITATLIDGDNPFTDTMEVKIIEASASTEVVPIYTESTTNPYDIQVVAIGNKLLEPETPSKEGHVFAGWYANRDFTKSWNFDTDTVGLSTAIYAKFVPVDEFVETEGVSFTRSEWEYKLSDNTVYPLTANISPSNASDDRIIWTVSDESVVRVEPYRENQIEFKGIKEGTATITATTARGGHSATFTITVIDDRAIQLNHTEVVYDMKSTNAFPLSAIENLPDSLVWTVSDESIIKVTQVDNNSVIYKGLKEGTATITVSSRDGQYSSVCTVTVVDSRQISLETARVETFVDVEQSLDVLFTPADTARKDVIWTVSDDTVVQITPEGDGSITFKGLKAGVATITATTASGKEISASCEVVVSDKIVLGLNGYEGGKPVSGIAIDFEDNAFVTNVWDIKLKDGSNEVSGNVEWDKSYTLEFKFQLAEAILEEELTANDVKLGDLTASTFVRSGQDNATVTFTLPAIEKTVIEDLDIYITPPIAGETPATTIIEKNGKVILQDSAFNIFIDGALEDGKYVEGNNYTFYISISAVDGYIFPELNMDLINNTYRSKYKVNGSDLDEDGISGDFSGGTTLMLIITFKAAPSHTHTYTNSILQKDAEYHWLECDDAGCPDKYGSIKDKAPHSGGKATCQAKAVCSCGQSYGEIGTHVFGEWHITVLPTCTNTGTKAHKDCTVCEKHFAADGITEIAILTIDKDMSNHTGTAFTYTTNNNGTHKKVYACCGTTAVEYEVCSGGSATCNTKKTCQYCNTTYGDFGAHDFTGVTLTEEIPATCVATGTKAHKDCTVCRKHFEADGVTEIVDLTIAINASNHDLATEWTGVESGHYHECKRAGCEYHDTITAHTPDRAEATETEPVKCTLCEYIITPALGHTTCSGGIKQNGQAATCTVNGWNDYYKCSGCNKIYTDAACTPANEITDLAAWKTGAGKIAAAHIPNADDGDCTTAITCSVCGETTTAASTHADTNTDGKCDACGKDMPTTPGGDEPGTTPGTDDPNTPDDPDKKDGLGTGAIVGIVIGSVAVAGVGGFALFWFVIKKKTWADFLAIFKKK